MFFIIALIIILSINLSWYFISDKWLRTELVNFPKEQKISRIVLGLWMALIVIPLVGMFTFINPLEYGPWIWIAVFYLWMGLIFFWMMGMASIGIPVMGITWLKARKAKVKVKLAIKEGSEAVEEVGTVESTRLNRRQMIKLGLVALPPFLVSGTSLVSWWAKDNLQVYATDLPVKNLPRDLEGFTITHLSDLHIGLLTGKERVDRMVRSANSQQSDMIVITGDLLDREFDYMPDLVASLSELRAPLGVYVCIGNHDKMENAEEFIRTVRKSGLKLLINEAEIIAREGTALKIMGIDFVREDHAHSQLIDIADNFTTAPENSLKILLAHHPHAFDAASEKGIPLTLAGHTHGGQVVLRLGEDNELFNPGRLLYRYVDGIYRSNAGNTLFVHKGSGDWFPLRTGAPTEVVQLRLVKDS